MKLSIAAQQVFEACKAVDEGLEVNFASDEITIYWEQLRFDVPPKDLGKALNIIKSAKAMGARFE